MKKKLKFVYPNISSTFQPILESFNNASSNFGENASVSLNGEEYQLSVSRNSDFLGKLRILGSYDKTIKAQ